MKRRLKWLGHMERMDTSRVPKYLLVSRPVRRKRSRGGQERRWNDVVVGDLKRGDLLEDWMCCSGQRGIKVFGGGWHDLHHLTGRSKGKGEEGWKETQVGRKGATKSIIMAMSRGWL